VVVFIGVKKSMKMQEFSDTGSQEAVKKDQPSQMLTQSSADML